MSLRVDIRKKLHGIDLRMAFECEAGHVGLLGESGSGKSMTLRCIAGIERPDEGVIEINGKTVFDSGKGIDLPPRQRGCGFLFQNYALFPHLTVRQNIALAVRKTRAEKKKVVSGLIEKFGLQGLEEQKPGKISGGQQQRLALARMLASDPSVILLDEPFSALDATVKSRVEEELARFLADYQGTILFVSHNRDEAYRFCDSLLIVRRGSVVESGATKTLFTSPTTLSGALLTGCKNTARAVLTGPRRVAVPAWGISLETTRDIPADITHIGIRAHSIREKTQNDTANCFDFAVISHSDTPFSHTLSCEALTAPGSAGGERGMREPLVWERAGETETEIPDQVTLCLPPTRLFLLKE